MVRATRSRRSVPRPRQPLALGELDRPAPRRSGRAGTPPAARGPGPGRSGRRPIAPAGDAAPRRSAPRRPRDASGSGPADQQRRRDPVAPHPEVDPVAQRPRDPAQVPLRDARRAGTGAVGRPAHAARARVHRRDEREPGGERLARPTRTTATLAVLERLAERLEHVAPELRQLVAHQRRPGRPGSPRRATGAGRRRPCRRTRSCGAGGAPAAGGPARDRAARRDRGDDRRRQRRPSSRSGSSPGIVRASSVLPAPGGPIRSIA